MGGECDRRSRGVSILSGHRRIWLAGKYNAGQQRSLRQHYGDMRIDHQNKQQHSTKADGICMSPRNTRAIDSVTFFWDSDMTAGPCWHTASAAVRAIGIASPAGFP
jgi:hypothetical protein